MASVAHFLYDAENIIDEIESRIAAVEELASRNFLCARTIQRMFRGYITRKHISLLHQSATFIQKNWRGFLGRIIYTKRLKEIKEVLSGIKVNFSVDGVPVYYSQKPKTSPPSGPSGQSEQNAPLPALSLLEKYDEMCWLYYNACAGMIQKWWKGYWVRLKVFSYYRLKAWLEFVVQQNKLFKYSVEAYQSKANDTEMKQREEEAKEWIVYILFKLHHLLRTHQLSGVYSLPNTTDLSEIEKLLKCLKYKDFMIFYDAYMEDLRQARAKELPPFIFPECKYSGHYEREFYDHKKPHKDFLFSRDSYHNPPQSFACMELRKKKASRNNQGRGEPNCKGAPVKNKTNS